MDVRKTKIDEYINTNGYHYGWPEVSGEDASLYEAELARLQALEEAQTAAGKAAFSELADI